jgi:hypothetical protein
MTALDAGPLRLLAWGHPSPVSWTDLLDGDGALDLCDIVLREGGTISGTVVTEDGAPSPGVTVWLYADQAQAFVHSIPAADDGRFEMPFVGDGAHRLVAVTPDTEPDVALAGAVDVVAGSRDVRVTPVPPITCTIVLIDRVGGTASPQTRIHVARKRNDGAGASASSVLRSSNPTAEWALRVAEAGTYDLTVRTLTGSAEVRGVILRRGVPSRVEVAIE